MSSHTAVLYDVPLTPADAQHLQRAFQILQSGQPSQARQICLNILASRPNQADTLHLLGLAYKAEGNFNAAVAAMQASLRVRPHQPQVLNNLGNLLGDRGRHAEALAAYRQALAIDPRFTDAWINYGLTADKADETDEAIKALNRAATLNPASAKAWVGLGSAYRKADRLDDAIAALRKATSIDSRNGKAWFNLGVILRMTGEPEAALSCFETAEKAGLRGAELLDARAAALVDLGRTQEGVALFKTLTEQTPTYVTAHQAFAKLVWEFKLPEEPTAPLRRALAEHPQNAELWTALLRILLPMEKWDETLTQVAQARKHLGDHPILDYAEGRARDGRGDIDGATAFFERTIASLPDDAVVRSEYARHLLRLKRPDAAAEQAEYAAGLNPDCQFAWAYLGTAWRLLGDSREEWLHDYDRLIKPMEIEPPAGVADIETFMATVEAALLPQHRSIQHPLEQSLRGGTQTEGTLFAQKNTTIQSVKAQIEKAIGSYIRSLPDDPKHPFLGRKASRVRFTGSWSVRLRSQGFHVNHLHSEGWVSSALYVQLPASVRRAEENSNAGCIQFGQPPVELGLDLAPRKIVKPEVGRLVLFPSYTWHGTIPFSDDETRLTIAFDAVPSR